MLSSNDQLKDAAEGRSFAVLVALRSHVSLDRNAPPTGNFRALVVYGNRMHAHSNAFRPHFSSLIVRAWSDKGRYIQETERAIGLKLGARLVQRYYYLNIAQSQFS